MGPDPSPDLPAPDPNRSANRLDLLKALGDNTRYAIYLELARSPLPLSTSDVADSLGLHPNTVRPHLERMRDVGLLRVDTEARGGVGRPQHLYSLQPDAPALGLEPSPFPTLARMLLTAAAAAGLEAADLEPAGTAQGRADAARWTEGSGRTDPTTGARPAVAPCVDALMMEQARLGFDPAVVDEADGATMAFAHCPFRALAEQHPELVCALHRGLVEGFVSGYGGAVVQRFGTLVDRTPCQVVLRTRPARAAEREPALAGS